MVRVESERSTTMAGPYLAHVVQQFEDPLPDTGGHLAPPGARLAGAVQSRLRQADRALNPAGALLVLHLD